MPNKFSFLLYFMLFAFASNAQAQPISIIPQPNKVEISSGRFVLTADTRIYYPKGQTDWATAAQYFMALAQPSTGFALQAQPMKGEVKMLRENAIYFMEDKTVDHAEGYRLEVQKDQIVIHASTAAGAFYAVQTLRQLFPAALNSTEPQAGKVIWAAPCCKVEDQPRFQYRGLHLDVGRNYFGVDAIKRYIDLLAAHKLNIFHWHLTEDQGWRIEIKKYPRLQTVAACRNETLIGHYGDEPQKFDGKKQCGYYSQEEVREVVEYAQKRFVTIVPEIEMPGHSQAALTAYPNLGCTGGPYTVATKWGVFNEVFCAGNEETFAFLTDVLKEVTALFPGQYVHIGGDECPKDRWKTCPKCQKRMADNGLKDEHELQSYFIKRAEKMLASLGKKIIGWDEILEGGLAPTAAVMSWRGIEGGIAAAKAHHDVIMTPTDNCYFDYYQSDPLTEPLAIGGFLTLEKVYGYEPVPTELTEEEAKYIIGTQGNLWTEYIQTPEKVEYMVWPRACALAEIAWTKKEQKDWKNFSSRIKKHFDLLDAMKVNYAKAYFDVAAAYAEGKVTLKTIDPNVQIRFTDDGTEPTAASNLFAAPFALQKSTTIKAAAFEKDKKLGKIFSASLLVHLASGKPYTLSHQPQKYTGGETYGLTNGVVGNLKKYDVWVAHTGHDLDPAIDLGTTTTISKVTTHFVNGKDFWIYPPRQIEVFVSDDGKEYVSVGKKVIDAEKMSGATVETVMIDCGGTKARFVKLVATNFGKIPEGAAGSGNPAWVFLDEVIVE